MQEFWFVAIAALWAGFFLLEGFDLGVGMLLPVVARTDDDRRVALRSIGPVWDGNEVWLIVAGAAMFAAFPDWYATVFSGFYLAFALLLVGLILRGIGIEYRGKAASAGGRWWCEAGVVVGSLLAALLLGVAFADFLRGVLLDSSKDMTGGFWDLVTPYGLLGGLVTVSLFAFHGATFLTLRTEGDVHDRAEALGRVLGPVAALLALVLVLWTSQVRGGPVSLLLALALVLALVVAASAARSGQEVAAFAATGLAAALVPIWTFAALFPDVLPARNDAALSLTVHNASSTPYTLKVMAVVTVVFLPLVIAYQVYAYWVFRARVTGAPRPETGGVLDTIVESARESAAQTLGVARPDASRPGPAAPPLPEPVPPPRRL